MTRILKWAHCYKQYWNTTQNLLQIGDFRGKACLYQSGRNGFTEIQLMEQKQYLDQCHNKWVHNTAYCICPIFHSYWGQTHMHTEQWLSFIFTFWNVQTKMAWEVNKLTVVAPALISGLLHNSILNRNYKMEFIPSTIWAYAEGYNLQQKES